jgi:uroporphyrinogen III methyltransferase/synthase
LGEIAEDAKRAGFKAPAVFVVGDVVALRERIRWFDNRPLFGKRVLVTRAREQASALSEKLRELGAEPVEFPVIRIEPMDDYAELDAKLQSLNQYDWAVFTSANGVRFVHQRLAALGLDARAFGGVKIACIGPGTAQSLLEIGIVADFVPTEYVAEGVLAEWPQRDMSGAKVLLPRAEEARDVLPNGLTNLGAAVDITPTYRTVLDSTAADEIRQQLVDGEIDVLTFTSSSTVKNFVQAVGLETIASLPDTTRIASIGPITSDTARELGLNLDIEAPEHTIDGLIDAVASLFAG